MAEYIDREAAINALAKIINESDMPEDWSEGISDAMSALFRIPAADVVPVRNGRWIDMRDFISCSECNVTRMKEFLCDYGVARRLDVRTNYCPNCGARMDGDEK